MKLSLLIILCLGTCAAGSMYAQSLEVTPAHVMADETAAIRVTGLQPQQHITIEATLIDGGAQTWASAAEFVADGNGVVNISKQAPVKGSYHGISAMGPIWSMVPSAKDVHLYEPPRELGAQTIDLRVTANGRQVATGQLQQSAIQDGVKQIRLRGILHGVWLIPQMPGRHPGVLVVGGSEGGIPLRKAAWLASHGYAALALAYFRYDDLPRNLEAIPLEYFGQALSWMMQQPEVTDDQIAVVGTSRGGELALQLGSMYPQIKAVVAYVPANVRYPACCGRDLGPAWTWKGSPLPYVLPRYKQNPMREISATIPVEQTHAPILVISGESDGVWDSRAMTDAVMQRLKQAHFPYRYEHLDYPRAGHRAAVPEIMPAWTNEVKHRPNGESSSFGGTAEGNAASTLDADPKVLAFLQQCLAPAVSQQADPTQPRSAHARLGDAH